MNLITDCPEELKPGINIQHREAVGPHDPVAIAERQSVHSDVHQNLIKHTQLIEPVTQGCIEVGDISPMTTLLVAASARESQFDQLLRAGMELPSGLAAVAVQGQQFHGQRGRPWSALPGNIHLSVVFHPQKPVQGFGTALTLVPALAAYNTLKRIEPDGDMGIKWVNDVLISGRKVSGVIAATRLVSTCLQSVVFGVGMNVETVPLIAGTPFVPAASSIQQEWGVDLKWTQVLPILLQELAGVWRELNENGAGKAVEDYKQASVIIGRDVVIYDEEADLTENRSLIAEGKVVDILPDLSLVLENQPNPVSRGRLAFM